MQTKLQQAIKLLIHSHLSKLSKVLHGTDRRLTTHPTHERHGRGRGKLAHFDKGTEHVAFFGCQQSWSLQHQSDYLSITFRVALSSILHLGNLLRNIAWVNLHAAILCLD